MSKRWLIPLAFSTTLLDMGFGKMMANIALGMYAPVLWAHMQYVTSSYGYQMWIGDMLTGAIAGATGVWLFAYSFWKLTQRWWMQRKPEYSLNTPTPTVMPLKLVIEQ